MSNQTLRRPPSAKANPGATRAGKAGRSTKSGRLRRQTAKVGFGVRRDGKPLIFGWGRHLSNVQKARYQHRAAYTFWGIVVASVLAVVSFAWLQQNVLIPNQAIVTINGTGITQETYRKYLTYEAQVLWNQMQAQIQEQQRLGPQIQLGNQAAVTRNQVLTSQLQIEESSYQQSSITQTTINHLVDDQLIQQSIQEFEAKHVPASKLVPSNREVAAQLAAFKRAFPRGETYQQFLNTNNMSEDDVTAAIRIDLRGTTMQAYLTGLLVSPAGQIHLRKIETSTAAQAALVLGLLKKAGTGANWDSLAKQDSVDPQTKNVGGDMGWVFQGGSDGAIENWAFVSGRKVNDLSPVINDNATGTYVIVQVLGIDPSRPIEPSLLSAAKTNALDHWLTARRALPNVHVSTPDANMLTANRNMPTLPNLNATLPSENPQVPGAPGGAPGTFPNGA